MNNININYADLIEPLIAEYFHPINPKCNSDQIQSDAEQLLAYTLGMSGEDVRSAIDNSDMTFINHQSEVFWAVMDATGY